MCGISGFMVRSNKSNRSLEGVAQSLRAMAHRGPDDAGIVSFAQNGNHFEIRPRTSASSLQSQFAKVALGHVRLSILDLSDLGHQPMCYEDRYWLTYNGEVYNYLELRAELQSLGHSFRSNTDSEVILAAYKQWGIDCFHRFNGMWGLAIYDCRNDELVVARDRFGVKPVYYAEFSWGWAFASEIKGLLSYLDETPRLNLQKLAEYFATGAPSHDENSMFLGIHQLLGGWYMRINNTGCVLKQWYSLYAKRRHYQQAPSDADASETLRTLLTDAVKIRLRSDVPVGACLSGGLDSSTIVMLMSDARSKQNGTPVQTFTYSAKSSLVDETRYATIVANAANTTAHFTSLDPDRFFEDLEKFIWHHDEPVKGPSMYAQWQVMRLARQNGVTVLLDGQGGDENLLGYHHYYARRLFSHLRHGRFISGFSDFRNAHKHLGISTKGLLSLGLYSSLPWVQTLYRRRRVCTLLSRRMHLSHDRLAISNDNGWRARQILQQPLPPLLRYEDRNSMAFGIETRLPMLDYRVVEFCQSLPDDYFLREGWTKWLLRKAFERVLPHEICYRKAKIGFEAPLDSIWQNHSNRIRSLLYENTSDIDRIINKRVLEQVAINPSRWPAYTWWLLNLKVWARIYRVTLA
jgi:asparagine synthase (glutamine-hydrolysing)